MASRSSALVNRTVIGQAQGILMERFRATPQEAFAMLRAASQRTNHKLSAVAAVVAETGRLP
ncbi:ANTAR domain-containing protein [Propioniciclava coleopterorum]|uniref:ANTAR domain-containing protein n=1 Tax=Propioniciclava coleopterorum TaxID=2714937 RepID=A0A6G7Y981_9ACTN|nr:ANTAR domain-containing protein [Propioniciclava coleopterorum]